MHLLFFWGVLSFDFVWGFGFWLLGFPGNFCGAHVHRKHFSARWGVGRSLTAGSGIFGLPRAGKKKRRTPCGLWIC
jgi:hypothetical protein